MVESSCYCLSISHTTKSTLAPLCERSIFKSTIVVSLLQPPPEVYSTFEDLILMAQG